MKTDDRFAAVEEDASYLRGRLEALSSLCAILVATHPSGPKIVEVLGTRAKEVMSLLHPTPFLEAYAQGFAGLEVNISETLAAFQRDELIVLAVPPDGRRH